MKTNNNVSSEEIKMNMLRYAEEKYNENFEVIDFNLAIRGLDSNYHDILVLKDANGVQFNVYSNTSIDDKFDDYGMSCADKLLTDYLKEKTDIELCAMVDLISDDQVMPSDVKNISVPKFSDKFEVGNITVVAKVDEAELETKLNELYKLYVYVADICSESMDFEVVSVQGENEKLNKLFSDIRLAYENDWSQYSSVKHTIVTTDKNLSQLQFAHHPTKIPATILL